MKRAPLRNLAASVRQRLMNLARARGEPFQSLLTRYAAERLLYRLSRSAASDRFVLKGALLFQIWSETPHRATRDIDLLGIGDPAVAPLAAFFRSLCALSVPDDGILFLEETVKTMAIREDNLYGGVRVTLSARLEGARIPVQVDVGFGDAVTPRPEEEEFPALLDFPAPRLRVYPREAVIAEKLQALVVLEMGNSRLKDYYDLYTLGQQFAFSGARLGEALAATFRRRDTPLPVSRPVGLTAAFAEDAGKQAQWSAFLRRQPLSAAALPLPVVVEFLAAFLSPVLEAARESGPSAGEWPAGGPWHPDEKSM